MTIVSISDLALEALEREYKRTTRKLLTQIRALTNDQRSSTQRALRALDEEADRLERDGKRMAGDNPYLLSVLAAYESALDSAQALILANDNEIEESAISLALIALTAKVFLPLAHEFIRRGGNPISTQAMRYYREEIAKTTISWNVPDALDFATRYVDSPAWIRKMDSWGKGYADMTRKTILEGVQKGWGPRHTASQIRRYAQELPSWAAESLTRTLQVTAYRDASVAAELMNDKYIIGKVRIAHLDWRTCLSCVALHGTELKLGERVDDHYRGRCSEFYRVPGGPEYPTYMQADSIPGKRAFVPFQKGADWFASLPEERQRQQLSFQRVPAKWRAYKAGTPLEAFVGEHVDDVFGRQIVELSLIRALGSQANEFYVRNQG